MPTEPARLLSALGARVRLARARRGLTAREVAERSGLSLRFYGLLENGSANIAFTRLVAVARALEVPVGELVAEPPEAPAASLHHPVALVGLRGAGKSTVGPLLARRLGRQFIELDERIEEKAGLSLAEIFAMHGEAWYRRLAAAALGDLVVADEPCVVSLPGSIVQDAEAWGLVRERCVSAWLRASPEEHMDRVVSQGDQRPIADRADAMGELRALLSAREPFYRQADVVVETSGRPPSEVADIIALEVEQGGSGARASAGRR